VLFEVSQPSGSLLFSPVGSFGNVYWKLFNSIFNLLISSLNVKNCVRKSCLNYLILLVEKNSFVLGKCLKNSVNYVAFIQAICHIYPSFHYPTDIFIRKANHNFRWIEILHSFAFLFLFSLFVDLSLLLYLNSFQLLKNSFYLVGKRTVLCLYFLD